MTDSFATLTDAALFATLSGEIDSFPRLTPADQQRIVGLARGLMERGMDLPFVMAGVRSSAGVLADLEEAAEDPVMSRPEVRRFVEENAAVTARSGSVVFRGNDVKRTERERLQQKTVSAIRDLVACQPGPMVWCGTTVGAPAGLGAAAKAGAAG